jgi:hypothetical protein
MGKTVDIFQDPPIVLKPEDLKGNQSREWRPRTGFTESRDQVSSYQSPEEALKIPVKYSYMPVFRIWRQMTSGP